MSRSTGAVEDERRQAAMETVVHGTGMVLAVRTVSTVSTVSTA